ncbi:MAG TPA: DUF4147 domain-containing protein, partial [Deinococcales bacterium]|nr:DUF4147 domain-containing protein [Deinococcales bacterium]
MPVSRLNEKNLLLGAWRATVAAADPRTLTAGRFPPAPAGRLCIIAAGKAALPMADAALEHYSGRTDAVEGVIAAPGPLPDRVGPLSCIEAEHPVPDAGSFRAGAAAAELAGTLGPDDLLLCLVSGGASALLNAPDGISGEEVEDLYRQLLASGLGITELNTVRRKLCRLKGGGLARLAAPARMHAL